MNEVHDLVCFDRSGKPLTHLTQWDINQTLTIHNSGFSYPPQFHFANKKNKSALVVEATLAGGIITCDIPNTLLREPYDIIVYMYTYNNTTSGKTIFIHRIPLIKRVRPDDYEYVDNKAVVSLINMMDLVKDLKSEIESKILDADNHLQIFDSFKNATTGVCKLNLQAFLPK